MMYLIVGRSGAGKDTVAEIMRELGLASVKSFTTRPRRTEDEDTHLFITEAAAARFADKVAVATINGYKYFATESQIREASRCPKGGIYIIDPKGAIDLSRNIPDEAFTVVHVTAPKNMRRMRAIARGSDFVTEATIFDKRSREEDIIFSRFTCNRDDGVFFDEADSQYQPLPKNIVAVRTLANEGEMAQLKDEVRAFILGTKCDVAEGRWAALKDAVDQNTSGLTRDLLAVKIAQLEEEMQHEFERAHEENCRAIKGWMKAECEGWQMAGNGPKCEDCVIPAGHTEYFCKRVKDSVFGRD